MTKIRIGKEQEDFVEQLLRFINDGQSEVAIEKLKSVDNRSNRFNTIYRLLQAKTIPIDTWKLELSLSTLSSLVYVHNLRDLDRVRDLASVLASDLASASVLAGVLASASARARDLASASASARVLDRVRDLASVLASDLADASASDLAHARNLRTLASASARDLARVLASASASARVLDRVRASDLARVLAFASDLAHDLDMIIEDFEAIAQIIINLVNFIPIRKELANEIEFRYQNRLAHIYAEILNIQHEEALPLLDVIATVIWDELQNLPIPITFTGEQGITSATLSNEIVPYLKALRDIQEVHDRLLNKEFVEPKIVEIHNPSPTSILKDFADAIQTLFNVFDFRKWKDEAKVRNKTLTEQDLNNEAMRNDINYEQRRRQIESIGDQDERIKKLKILDEEYKQKRIETDKKIEELRAQRLENIKSSIEVADMIYERWGIKPGLDEMGQDLTEQLIEAVVVIKESPRQIQLGHRPTSVPELNND